MNLTENTVQAFWAEIEKIASAYLAGRISPKAIKAISKFRMKPKATTAPSLAAPKLIPLRTKMKKVPDATRLQATQTSSQLR